MEGSQVELSLSMYSMHRAVKEKDWGTVDFLRFCSGENYRLVELLAHFWKDVRTELDDVVSTAKSLGIGVTSYAVSNNFVSADSALREQALRKITDGLPIAAELGTNVIRVFSGSLAEGIQYEDAKGWIIEGLKEACREAERAGMTLCLENHGKLAGKGAQVKGLIDQVGSPALKSTFDTGNFLLVDEHPLQAFSDLKGYIGHVHFKDFKEQPNGRYKSIGLRAYEGVPAGEGDAELPRILDLLAASGYNGAYVLEYEGTGVEADGIRQSYTRFEEMTRKYNG
jgi:sugar phosphate isomerase/epimerase